MTSGFNVENGVKVPRKLLMHFVNVGTGETPEWERLGAGVEDSSIETNFETETANDILGNSETTVNGASPSQSFDPFTVRGGSKLAFMLYEIWKNKQYEKLSNFEMLTVTSFVGSEAEGFEAYTEKDCTITFERIGGSAYVDMPITVNYSDKKVQGTATIDENGVPKFTPATAGIAE
jgi:hypothetical protein